MSRKERNIMPNVMLKPIYLGGLARKDFLIVVGLGVVSITPNFILMTVYSKFDFVSFFIFFVITGLAGTLLYRIEYNQRCIDIIFSIIKYKQKGDRLYESVEFKKRKGE